ncbi:MAG: RecQ family ATP-dependent DNA helicase [Anaerolineae bacterium]|nr:RecQ family ATP-dependent DNA helicase [Anaerolineae bacterium]
MSAPPLMDDFKLYAALEKYFGYSAFRPGQLEALHHILAKRDTLVVMPTGSGKSLIYQMAALVQPGTALVISPLVALMKDQTDSLTRRGIAAAFINSTLTVAEQDRRLAQMARGEYRIVLVAPERLRSGAFRGALKRVELSLLAIDEAHCLSQWGHDFRPDYLRLAEARRNFEPPVTLALTATATTRVQDDIVRLLEMEHAARLVTGFNRPNLYLQVLNAADARAKLRQTREFLAEQRGAGIIYAGTRRDAEEVAEFVREVCKLPAAHYHAGLDNELRAATQDKFLAGDLSLVVATNAFGMGIDRPDVRFVLHYTMPGTLEAYYQEAGRAGRDGLPAHAALIYSPKDTALHESFIANDSPTENNLRAVHQYLAKYRQISLVNVEQILGLRETTVKVALEQLEAGGLIRREPYDEFGVMRVQVEPLDEKILREIAAQVETRKNHKRHLLGKIVSYAETNACRRRTILDYFGDSGDAGAPLCCDNDVARAEMGDEQETMRAATTEAEQIPLTVLEAAQTFQRKIGKGKLADILKGSKAKDVQYFVKSPHYGKLMALRRNDLENLIQQLIDDSYLKQVGGEYPTLQLTPRGEHALKTRARIQTNIRPPQPSQLARAYAERQAGGTIALSGQLLAQGLTPEQIAALRGLTIGTIYSHLAQLISQGQVDINRVVPQELQNQIREAIEQVGSAQYLAPIKARLPADLDYAVIRCVANAWLRERGQPSLTITPGAKPIAERPPEDAALFQKLRAWRTEQARREQVAPYMVFLDAVLHELATYKPTTRQALLDIKGIGPNKVEKYGVQVLEVIEQSLKPGSTAPTVSVPPDSVSVDDFLAKPHARLLTGPWRAGWALDFHSRFDGETQNRGVIGDLVFRYKYRGEQNLARELAARWADLVRQHPELPSFYGVIPVPPSAPREFDPVGNLARALAKELKIPASFGVLVKTRATKQQKEMSALAQKQANVRGAFALQGDVRGKHILLVDDLYDSGATLQEAARVLQRGGAASIVVLTLTKTIHTDR